MAKWQKCTELLVAAATLFMCCMRGMARDQVYIVHLDGHRHHVPRTGGEFNRRLTLERDTYHKECVTRHDEILKNVSASSSSKLFSLSIVMNGFVAVLSESQVAALKGMEGVLSVRQDEVFRPQTTYTPFLLELNKPSGSVPPGLWSRSKGRGVVIAFIDTGIWPEDKSFNDTNFFPPPEKFNGSCQTGTNWTADMCNNKIVAARYFTESFDYAQGVYDGQNGNPVEYKSARDSDGHGSHVASIAAGVPVPGASIGSFEFGTPFGIAYEAHIAVYKVCFGSAVGNEYSCYMSAIQNAFEQAVRDNVDVISVSLGGDSAPEIPWESAIDYGALAAAVYGIPTVVSAGNNGPDLGSVSNVAPWYLSVGATTVPRTYTSTYENIFRGSDVTSYKYVYTGNSQQYKGFAATNGTVESRNTVPLSPLVYGGSASLLGNTRARFCSPESLDMELVSGKIVICDRGNISTLYQGYNVLSAGGIGMVLREIERSGRPLMEYHLLPAIHVDYNTGVSLLNYARSDGNATAAISDVFVTVGSPPLDPTEVVYFSARGPNPQTNILKPDLVAPGYEIFAAWTQNPRANKTRVSRSLSTEQDPRTTQFAFVSGTSMSCPHVSGTVALLKAIHPTWSPGALYSAVLTTAKSIAGTPFDVGHGFLNPNSAADPGLVYDARVEDYALYSCLFGTQLETSLQVYECDPSSKSYDYNTPSVMMSDVSSTEQSTVRRVMNKGPENVTYTVSIVQPPGAQVDISPAFLSFNGTDQELTFTITVVGLNNTIDYGSSNYSFGEFTWTSGDGNYTVRSPIAVRVTGLSTSISVNVTNPSPSPPYFPIIDETPLVRAPPKSNVTYSPPDTASILSPPQIFIPSLNRIYSPPPSSSRWQVSRVLCLSKVEIIAVYLFLILILY